MASKHPTILIPTDFSKASDHAIGYGLELAERLGTTVELVFVAPKLKPLFPRNAASRRAAAEFANREIDEAREALAELRKRSKLVAATRVLRGVPYEEIVAYANRKGAECIVIGTTGHTLAGTVLGSTTERVLRYTTIPVVVVPARAKKSKKRATRKRAARSG